MQRLESLALDAAQRGAKPRALLQICNACRYCEGFCAVFPAMTRRLEFGKADVHYLANLCHNCGACLHACQYAPPHEFAVNVPQAMAKVRRDTYAEFAWPRALGALYARNGLTLSVALAAGSRCSCMLAAAHDGSLWRAVAGNFYAIFPHNLMVALFAPVFLFAMLALGIGVRRFWRQEAPGPASGAAVGEATHNALRLKYLDGGHGEAATTRTMRSPMRAGGSITCTFYGFLLCFAATCVATVYHYFLGWPAPYALTSLPKLLGIVGGIGLVVGTVGLFVAQPAPPSAARRQTKRRWTAAYRAAVPHGATGLALMLPSHVGHGAAAGHSPRRRDGAVPDAAVRQVRARDLPRGGFAQMGDRAPAAEPVAAGIRISARDSLEPRRRC